VSEVIAQGKDIGLLSMIGKAVFRKKEKIRIGILDPFLKQVKRCLLTWLSKRSLLIAWVISSSPPLHWDKIFHKDRGDMNLCDLESFNLAMLGKQGVKLTTKNKLFSLLTQVLKAKYFPRTSFLDAKWS
jgi:hypothetical protein